MPFSAQETDPGWDPLSVHYRLLASCGLHNGKSNSPLASSPNLWAWRANKASRLLPLHPRISWLYRLQALGLMFVGGGPVGVPFFTVVFQSREAFWNTVIR